MKRNKHLNAKVSLVSLLALLAVACGDDPSDPAPSGGAGTGGSESAGAAGNNTGGSSAGSGGSSAGAGGSDAGSGGTNAGSGGTNAGSGGDAGSGGSDVGGSAGSGGAEACGELTFNDPDCNACATGANGCCAENDACSNEPDCLDLLACIQKCTDSACDAKCKTDHATGSTLLDALNTCVADKCAEACNGPAFDNHTFETAEPITVDADTATSSVITDFTNQKDFYKFTGTKGQKLILFANGKPSDDPFGNTYPDLVITLYGADKKQIAANDDPPLRGSNNPELVTILPADGDYYVRVVECNGYEKGGPSNCSPAADITQGNYNLLVLTLDTTQAGNVGDTEPNDTSDKATAVTYAPNPSGGYYLTLIAGAFSSAADTDVYSFKLPSDLKISSGRSTGNFTLYPVGVDGNGSTSLVGEATIAAAANPTTAIAKLDLTKLNASGESGDFGVPLSLGTDYLLTVKHPGTAAGANDFYVLAHNGGGSNPVEKEKADENNLFAGAEALEAQVNDDGSTSYFLEGDLLPAGTDQDHFSVQVPSSKADQVSISCSAQRSGSGLRGLKVSLLDATGQAVAGASKSETETEDLRLQNIAVPAGQATLAVKIEAASQAADVSSAFYRCGIHFSAK